MIKNLSNWNISLIFLRFCGIECDFGCFFNIFGEDEQYFEDIITPWEVLIASHKRFSI